VAVTCQLTERGFSTKNRDKVNDDRLWYKIIFTNEVGKYVGNYDEDTYLHILHYGFDGKYLPIGFDVLFIKDIKNMRVFRRYFGIACSTLLNDINLRGALL
jgi:hypothetical protein